MEKNPVKHISLRGMACFLLLSLLFISCNQDHIFFKISTAVEPREPRIKGVPTNFVRFPPLTGDVYVANLSALYRYDGGWSNPPNPGGEIKALAATNTYLYALTSSGLHRFNGTFWAGVSITYGSGAAYFSLQSIYGAGDAVFVSGWNRADDPNQKDKFAIFYVADSGTAGLAKAGTARLTGAVKSGTEYYLSTNGAGIYYLSSLTATPQSVTGGGSEIMGLIKAGTDVVAVARNGDILRVTTTTATKEASTGQIMTGAIALWKNLDDPTQNLLLLGIMPPIGYSGTTYGYREIVLSNSGNLPGNPTQQKPGTGDFSSIETGGEDKYDTTIGSRPVNHLFQAPDGTLFAAVQGTGTSRKETNSGVWSYRSRDGEWQWNAEE
ncbi:hypothetical protein AGMMS49587_04570 [Spirochaetia bacterium]|nr:hypothetical protein AGMMS49587_04570 [Spirochaetia bacterium]